jgi:predicted lipoprotein with Yx(FWY)xxD motif
MRFNALFATAALGVVALAACGGTSSSADSAGQPVVPVTVTMSAVKSGDTSLGRVLTSSTGRTLYALTTDTASHSSCTGACANVWPPVLVGKGWTAASGLDRTMFTTTNRAGGARQLVAGQWPLYTFSGDTAHGDVNGQGSGGVWFAVGSNGKLIKNAPSSPTTMPVSSGY